MKKLLVDYVSDLHLGFYLPYDSKLRFSREDIARLVEKEIIPKKQGEILMVGGDICEDIDAFVYFVEECAKVYERVFFVAGNHEYYIMPAQRERYGQNSFKKIDEIYERTKDNPKLVFLDRSNPENHGKVCYKDFIIAGDTLFYTPIGQEGLSFYLTSSNDSNYITIPPFTPLDQIYRLHLDSMEWYDRLPECDIILTHVPPVHNPSSHYAINSCYYATVKELKTKVWIYGHDHVNAMFKKADTMFYSNPWGYYSASFPIKTIEVIKE